MLLSATAKHFVKCPESSSDLVTFTLRIVCEISRQNPGNQSRNRSPIRAAIAFALEIKPNIHRVLRVLWFDK